jgi:hypothetical protein
LRLVESEDIPLGAQVHARAESPARAGHDDGADGVVLVHLGEGALQLLRHLDGEGVELPGTVERDGKDPVLDIATDGAQPAVPFIVHA